MKKCNLCDREGTRKHPFIQGGYLCDEHHAASEAKRKTKPGNPPKPHEAGYLLDKQELKALRMDGLLPLKTYVYMALMIDNPGGAEQIDMKAFCMKWGVPAYEFLQAIGQLGRKGLVNIRPQDLKADVLNRSQRQDALKEVVNVK